MGSKISQSTYSSPQVMATDSGVTHSTESGLVQELRAPDSWGPPPNLD